MSDIFIGRQPIYDRQLGVYAYELLFRGASVNCAQFSDGDQATSNVIVNAFMEIGLDNIVSQQLAFINLTRAFFVDQKAPGVCLPRHRVVLEVLEHVEPDVEVLEGVRRLSTQGYTIALDDFVYHRTLRPLLELADIVKLDVMALDRSRLRSHVRLLRRYPVKLVAEKVETLADFNFCLDLGFDYFQGYFFAQPQIIRGERLPHNRLTILNLLSQLQNPDISAEQLEALIRQNPTFSERILRHANSAALDLEPSVESLQQAFTRVGVTDLKSWTTVLAMAKLDDKPTELVVTSMIRGKMAEMLSTTLNADKPESFFTVGLFSTLDALMDNGMEAILDRLPLPDHLADALLHRRGVHGEVLDCVLAYERGRWDRVRCRHLTDSQIQGCYLAALHWASQASRDLIEQ
jgi:EAL and modified HD-GYP domain-containing signal transduction protein